MSFVGDIRPLISRLVAGVPSLLGETLPALVSLFVGEVLPVSVTSLLGEVRPLSAFVLLRSFVGETRPLLSPVVGDVLLRSLVGETQLLLSPVGDVTPRSLLGDTLPLVLEDDLGRSLAGEILPLSPFVGDVLPRCVMSLFGDFLPVVSALLGEVLPPSAFFTLLGDFLLCEIKTDFELVLLFEKYT